MKERCRDDNRGAPDHLFPAVVVQWASVVTVPCPVPKCGHQNYDRKSSGCGRNSGGVISLDEASKLLNIIDGYSAQKKWDSKGLAFIEADTDDEDPTVEFSPGLRATTIKLKVL